ncbi:MAG: cupredoxin domain-containing protein [Bdellovibrionales bacterium]|nr:cupredoxin domain-containing protein [Bdellovibrionales bacterium]
MKTKWSSAFLRSLAFLFLVTPAFSAERTFRLLTVEINGTKFWLPSTLVVQKGDTVKIEAVTKLEGASAIHGLSIPEMKIQEVVDNKSRVFTFKADRAGVFPITCHLHPPHIPSQLVVLE